MQFKCFIILSQFLCLHEFKLSTIKIASSANVWGHLAIGHWRLLNHPPAKMKTIIHIAFQIQSLCPALHAVNESVNKENPSSQHPW